MPTSAIDSLIFRDMFGSPAMREIWSDAFRTQKYLDWEAALGQSRLFLDHAAEAQPDLLLLYPRLRRISATGGGGAPRRDG
jgi:hypothetical protein